MTAVAPSTDVNADEPASAHFYDALCRVFPGCYPADAQSVTLVALLDDASLATVIAVGSDPRGADARLLWSDDDWADLVQATSVAARPRGKRDHRLVPVMLGPILSGAIDGRGPCPPDALGGEVLERASEEFLSPLIKRIHG